MHGHTNAIQTLAAPLPYRLWRTALTALPSNDELQVLGPDERAASMRLADERDRRRYLAAHVALRVVIASSLGTSPAGLHFTTGPFGKPALLSHEGCGFSLSRSGDIAVIATARDASLGVDVEVIRDVPDAMAIAMRHFTARECGQLLAMDGGAERDIAFLRCWTRKEACLKAIGTGLTVPPQGFEVGTQAACSQAVIPGPTGPLRVQVESLPAGAAMVVSIARVLR